MISGSGNNRHRHARDNARTGRGVRARRPLDEPDTWPAREPDTWPARNEPEHYGPAHNELEHPWAGQHEPDTWAGQHEPDTWAGHYEHAGWDEPNTWSERLPRAKRPLKRVIVPMAIPMALALALGMVLALSGKPSNTKLDESSLNGIAGQTGNAGQNANAGQTGNAGQNANENAIQATNAVNPGQRCELIVPLNTLTARGLATPWELTGPGGESPASSGCEQSNPELRAFVQATILDPATGALSVYEPLVVTLGSAAAVAPVVPQLPKGAVIDIIVGFNGHSLQLAGAGTDTLASQKCVDGANGSLFGQVAYCNSVAFFTAADQAIADRKLKIPASGTSTVTGQPCPTARSFDLAGQDLGDGVTTDYLLTASGATAQFNAANRAALPGTTTISDVGDGRVLDDAVLPALGCAAFTAPNLSAGGAPGTSPTLEELSAAQNQQAPIALVPENDPMTMVNGAFSFVKTTLYREGAGQPFDTPQADTPASFCANMLNIQTAFLAANATRFFAMASPIPAVGDNLLTYLASRLSASYSNLRCASYGLRNTVRLIRNSAGVATGAVLTVTAQQPNGSPAPTEPTPPPQPAAHPQPTSPGQPTAPAPAQSAVPGGQAQPGGGVWWYQTP
jgi:hypothetical protein